MAKRLDNKETTYSGIPVLLFREDLEWLIEVLKRDVEEGKVEIRDDNYIYDSLDDLKANVGAVTDNLEVTRSGRYHHDVTIRLYKSGTTWLRSDNEALFLKLKEMLQSKKRPLWRVIQILFFPIICALLVFTVLAIMATLPIYIQIIMLVLYLIAVFLGIVLYLKTLPGLKNKIILVRRHERESFFKRNSEKVIVAVISSAAGALLLWLIKKLIK